MVSFTLLLFREVGMNQVSPAFKALCDARDTQEEKLKQEYERGFRDGISSNLKELEDITENELRKIINKSRKKSSWYDAFKSKKG